MALFDLFSAEAVPTGQSEKGLEPIRLFTARIKGVRFIIYFEKYGQIELTPFLSKKFSCEAGQAVQKKYSDPTIEYSLYIGIPV